MKKDNKIKYLLIIVGVIFLTFGSIKMIFTTNDGDSNNKKDKEEIKYEVLYEKDEKAENIQIKEEFDDKETDISCFGDNISNCQLSINEKYILDNNDDRVIENIYKFGNAIIILVSEKAANYGYLYLVDNDGVVIDTIGEKMEFNLLLKMVYPSEDFKTSGNKISFYMTSIQNERKLLAYDGTLIDIDDNEQLSKYNILDETLVAGKYEIEYLQDGKFSDIKLVESKTYKELKEELND